MTDAPNGTRAALRVDAGRVFVAEYRACGCEWRWNHFAVWRAQCCEACRERDEAEDEANARWRARFVAGLSVGALVVVVAIVTVLWWTR